MSTMATLDGWLGQLDPDPGSDEVPETVEASAARPVSLPGALFVNRGYVAVPSADVRAYAAEKARDMIIGFVGGVAVGVVLGNVFDMFGSFRRHA